MAAPFRLLPVLGSAIALSLGTGLAAQAPDPALAQARRILERTILVDGHNDLPWEIRTNREHPRDVDAYDLRDSVPGYTDLARLKAGRVGAQFWSIYVPGEDRDSGYARIQLEEFDIARRMIARYPDRLALALTADDILRARRQGRIASLLGMEGGHAIENSLGALRAYYELGARYLTLTHNVTLDWADAAQDTLKHGGLTPFGREVVREMNRLGMLVDVSHTADETVRDVLAVATRPVMASHSSARALTDHHRNLSDELLRAIGANGGVVMVNYYADFIDPAFNATLPQRYQRMAELGAKLGDDPRIDWMVEQETRARLPRTPLSVLVDHIDHIAKVAGVDHVGLGSDFDGAPFMPVGIDGVQDLPKLSAALKARGYSDADLAKILGGNILRVLEASQPPAP